MAENAEIAHSTSSLSQGTESKKHIALYGGSFNPVHVAHLRMAQFVLDELHLNKLYLLPNASPPHKRDHSVLSFEQRVELLELALNDFNDPRIEISFLEQDQSVLHYTYNTLQACCETYKDCELSFIMGMDSFFNLDSWKRGLELIDLANIVVLNRPSYHLSALPSAVKESMELPHDHRYIILNSPNYSFSSTEIRKALRAFQSPKDKYDFSFTYRAYLQKALTPSTLKMILDRHYYSTYD